MKKCLLLILFVMVFVGCEKIDKLTQFNLEYNETFTIPSTTIINLPINLTTPDIESNSESSFAVNDTRKDLIEEIILNQLALNLESPEDSDFGFLKSIEIYISADDLDDVKIAWKNDISASSGKYIELETSEIDVKEFIKKDEFILKVTTITNEAPSSDHVINIYSVFYVDAKILGQ